jgi:putative transposase
MPQRAYRYRFYPTPQQAVLLGRTFGCARFVYNWALRLRTDAWYQRHERVSYAQTSAALTTLKQDPDRAWLNEVSCVPLQQALRHLQGGFANFWAGRARYPSFKSKHGRQAAEYTRSAFRWQQAADGTGTLHLAKLAEPLRIRWSRPLPNGAAPSTVTITRDPAGRWHVCMLVAETIAPLPPVDTAVGLDAGLTALVTLSTGEKIRNPKHADRHRTRLARAQRNLSRKQQGSANRAKARVRVARAHARIVDARRDHLHKLSTRLVRENQTVVVEDLNVNGMVRNHTLARAISDAAWSELLRQLTYKAHWYGRNLVKIDRWYPSSKRCAACGHVVDRLPLSVRTWACPACDASHDRDVNAAVNILAAGLAVTVCGDGVRPPRAVARVGDRR